ncbi:TPR-like protein [Auriculariales sp. MPI-PUGE-AT-0066]|nr:TPR-like protein [Auriculariales sp. MPI-PUGE-AT-0066]
MASFIKNKLKSARELLAKKDYAAAKNAAEDVLSYEPDNYNANVFLGLSNLELGNKDAAEQAYRKATTIAPEQLLAWQGLSKLFERTEQWDKYIEALHALADLLVKSDDAQKLAEQIQRIIDLRRSHGTPQQLVEALKLTLPASPYYTALSSLPGADASAPTATTTFDLQRAVHHTLPTLEEIVSIVEKEEQTFIKREIDKRRTRLNAGPIEQVKREVGREVWSVSQLPTIYAEIFAHPDASEPVRRAIESKLLRYRLQYLQVLGTNAQFEATRETLSAEIMDMLSGMVLLKIPDELAWTTYLDAKNALHIADYDWSLLRTFCELFPESLATKQLEAYIKFTGEELGHEGNDEDVKEQVPPEDLDEDVLLEDMMTAFEKGAATILGSRLLADIYSRLRDHTNSIKVTQIGVERVNKIEAELAVKLDLSRRAFNIILATGLVHHFPPKHHSRAIPILDDILSHDPDNVASLLARGYVLQSAQMWEKALNIFNHAARQSGDTEDNHLEAAEESGWCLANLKRFDEAEASLCAVLETVRDLDNREEQKARLSWRIGRCLWGAEKFQEAYSRYIAALRFSNEFASAFTSLGIYYLNAVSPPDTARASKCFQKAFELDAREASAAQYLAEGFADEQEWDLVEIVAKRTIEGESGQSADPVAAQAQKYLPINAWAWKALGIVELNHRNYQSSIGFLQIALRADDKDAAAWSRLGEAYLLSGRHMAALKSFVHAKDLDPTNWAIDYFVAWVKFDLTEYDEAVTLYRRILDSHPEETGVSFALANASLLAGKKHRATGFFARSLEALAESISLAVQLLHSSVTFKSAVWKLLNDSLLELPMTRLGREESLFSSLGEVLELLRGSTGEVSAVLPLPTDIDDASSSAPISLILAAHVAQSRVHLLAANDGPGRAAALHDLSIVLHRVALSVASKSTQTASRKFMLKVIRECVKLDPNSDAHWVTLGVASFEDNVEMAQHAFIRAIEIDGTNASHWAQLGLLYLHHGDRELANQALFRAQLLDPDLSMAWGGQALVAIANGHNRDAQSLLTQSVNLTEAQPAFELEYAARELRSGSPQSQTMDQDRLLAVFAVLDRLVQRQSENTTGLYLLALVCERLHLYSRAIESMLRCSSIVETLYEQTEDSDLERRFVFINSAMGRFRLANGDYDDAIVAIDTARSLLTSLTDDDVHVLTAHGQFVGGLARVKTGDLEGAVELLEAAVQNVPADWHDLRGHASLLLAQTLWSLGTAEARSAASGQLLECISANPEDLAAIVSLASMGLLLTDDDLVNASLSEILSLPLHQRLELDPRRDVVHIRVQRHLLLNEHRKALLEAQRARHVEPNGDAVKTLLARFLVQSAAPVAAASVLSLDGGALSIDAATLRLGAAAAIQSDKTDDIRAARVAQRAIMLQPWDKAGWRTLAATVGTN